MRFEDAAVQVLREAQEDLPADMIAARALDHVGYKSQAVSRKMQIQSLAGTMASIVTRYQPKKPPSKHIFYRQRVPHPKTGRVLYLYGLTEWQRNGPAPSNNGSVPQAAPVRHVTIPLEGTNRETIELLVRSGKYPSATEAVLAAVGWGLEAKAKELAELKEWLDEIKRIPL